MKINAILSMICIFLLISTQADARGGHHAGGTSFHKSTSSIGVLRDSHGRIKRSAAAKHAFEKIHPCPSTGKSSGSCPGYVVDHVTALKRGGADDPSNMQWQTKAEAKAKDRWE